MDRFCFNKCFGLNTGAKIFLVQYVVIWYNRNKFAFLGNHNNGNNKVCKWSRLNAKCVKKKLLQIYFTFSDYLYQKCGGTAQIATCVGP